MSYYRAALSAAADSDLTAAWRLINCSIAAGENAPSAGLLRELLRGEFRLGAGASKKLRKLLKSGKCKKALKLRLPDNSVSHTVRGLLYAHLGRRRAAIREFTRALILDKGNSTAALARKELVGAARNSR